MRQTLPASSPRPAPISRPWRCEEFAADLGFVDPVGNGDEIELRQARGMRNGQAQAHRLKARFQRVVVAAVARPACFEAFLLQREKSFVEGVDGVDRSGVMIGPARAPPQ